MSLLDKQNQKIGDDSIGFQAGRDIKISAGLNYQDVKNIFNDLFELNFEKVREEAKEIARFNYNIFLDSFEKVFKEKINNIDKSKLKEPNFQNNLSETIKATSIRGEKCNLNLISEILALSIEKDSGDKIELIASESLTIAPKLSRQQFSFLATIFLIQECHMNVNSIEEITDNYHPILQKLLIAMDKLTTTDRQALIYFRAYSYSQIIFTRNVFQGLANNYGILLGKKADENRIEFEKYSPEFTNMMNSLEIYEFNNYSLSPIGKLLGVQFLKEIHPINFDLKSWIN